MTKTLSLFDDVDDVPTPAPAVVATPAEALTAANAPAGTSLEYVTAYKSLTGRGPVEAEPLPPVAAPVPEPVVLHVTAEPRFPPVTMLDVMAAVHDAPVVSDADYFAAKALSGSDLRTGYICPDDAAWRRANPAESKYLTIGNAIHLALLQPDKFLTDVARKPEGHNGATKEGKIWVAENAGKYQVSAEIYDRALAYVHAFAAVTESLGIDDSFTVTREVPIFWDEDFGACRCKPDYLADQPVPEGRTIHLSLKTTAKPVSRESWQYELVSGSRSAGYDIAEYHYARGIAEACWGGPDEWRKVECYHVVATTTGAPRVAVIRILEAVLERAERLWLGRAPAIAAAVQRGLDGVIVEPIEIDLPRWAEYATPDEFATEEESA